MGESKGSPRKIRARTRELEALAMREAGAKTLYGFSERWKKWGTDAFVEKERRPRMGHRFGTGEDHWKHAEGRGDNEEGI